MPTDSPLDDDLVAELLKQDAKSSSSRYSAVGLEAFLMQKSKGQAPKPNTRFLRNIIRETDSHNAALKAKEEAESRARLRALRPERSRGRSEPSGLFSYENGQEEDVESSKLRKRRRVENSEDGSREREKRHKHKESRSRRERSRERERRKDRRRHESEYSSDEERRSRRSHRRHHRTGSRTRDSRSRRERRKEAYDGNSGDERRSRRVSRREIEDKDRDAEEQRHRKSHRRGSSRTRERERSRSAGKRRHRRHKSRERSLSSSDSSRSQPRDSRLQRERDDSPRRISHKENQSRAKSRRKSHSSDSDSDPLDAFIGPSPPKEPVVRSKGRGAFKSSSAMDAHFVPGYDPTVDVRPNSDEEDEWSQAIEAFRDRAKWKQQGGDRLRAAGFTEDEIKKWEKGGEKTEEDVVWAKKGEGREWDRGKVVDNDGQINLRAEWGRLKGT